MKKFLRGLYIATFYIIGAPIALVYLFVMFIYCLIGMKRDTGEFYVGDLLRGLWDGLKEGHDMLMFWVRYGEFDRYGYITVKVKERDSK